MFAQFNWLDYCLIGLICFSGLIGFARGLVQELSSVANWVLGLWSGFIFYDVVAAQLPSLVQPLELRYLLGFFIIFACVLTVVTLLSKGVQWLVVSIGLKGPDGILGVFFGGLRGIVFVVLFIVVTHSSLGDSSAWQSSVLIPYFRPLEYWFTDLIPYDFQSS